MIDGFPKDLIRIRDMKGCAETLISPNSRINFLISEGALDLEFSAAAADQASHKKNGRDI